MVKERYCETKVVIADCLWFGKFNQRQRICINNAPLESVRKCKYFWVLIYLDDLSPDLVKHIDANDEILIVKADDKTIPEFKFKGDLLEIKHYIPEQEPFTIYYIYWIEEDTKVAKKFNYLEVNYDNYGKG